MSRPCRVCDECDECDMAHGAVAKVQCTAGQACSLLFTDQVCSVLITDQMCSLAGGAHMHLALHDLLCGVGHRQLCLELCVPRCRVCTALRYAEPGALFTFPHIVSHMGWDFAGFYHASCVG